MKFLKNFIFETLVFLILGYVLLFSVFFRSADFGNKLLILSFSLIILATSAVIRYSFGEVLTIEYLKILSYFSKTGKGGTSIYTKVVILVTASLFIFLLISLIDVLVYVFQTGKNPVAFGFPILIYSFVQKKFLLEGFLFNIILFSSLLYLLIRINLKK